MAEIGLTGGIGVGKSTVATGLVDRGAALIDADAIVRELQAPGEPVFEAMIGRWGDVVLSEDGSLNRAAVADIVFHDRAELIELNTMVHPAAAAAISERRRLIRSRQASAVVVLEIPLLAESCEGIAEADCARTAAAVPPQWPTACCEEPSEADGGHGGEAGGGCGAGADRCCRAPLSADSAYRDLDGIAMVDAAPEIALQRLVEGRGFTEEDARARMAVQAGREARLALADFVIDNNGSHAELEARIDACWQWASSLASNADRPSPLRRSG